MACKNVKNIEELFEYEDNMDVCCNIQLSLIEDNITDEYIYRDKLHIYIDEYVVKYPNRAKKLVNDYDVFRSIKLSRENFGEFEIQEGKQKNYMMLGYVLIDEYFKKYYGLEELREQMNWTDTEDSEEDKEEDNEEDKDDVSCI